MAAKMSRPQGVVPSIGLANSLMSSGQTAAAEHVVRFLVQVQPRDGAAWHLLSIICNMTQRTGEAIEAAERALATDARRADYHFAHGRALKSAQRLDEAVAAYERAVALAPRRPDIHVSLGIAYRLLGRLDDAAEQQRAALKLSADYAPAWINLANVLAERITREVGHRVTAEDMRDAEQALRRALTLAPRNADALHNLGIVMKLTGRYDEAVDALDRCLAVDSSRIETLRAFGGMLLASSRHEKARTLYEMWMAEHEPDAEVLTDLATCLVELGEFDAAQGLLDKAEALAPGSARVRHQRGRVESRSLGNNLDNFEAIRSFRASIDVRPDYYEAVCSYLLMLCYVEEDPWTLAREHEQRVAACFAEVPVQAPPRYPPREGGPLRVGYVSSDFKRHSVAYFLEGLLESRDRQRHEVVAYKCNVGSDRVTHRLQALCDQWVDASTMSDEQLWQRCRDDRLDVLVDLAGLTSGARLGAFHRRAAACQVTWLGYPTTTGARCFDFRFTDAVIDPISAALPATEAPWRLPGSMFCYRPGEVPPVVPPPALERGHVTFGSFNNFLKAGAPSLGLWLQVLQAVPGAHLRLKAAVFTHLGNREAVWRYFEQHGVARERIEFSDWAEAVQDHLAAYGEIDIALDTFPYNGATTSCEALTMGVPVVTRSGPTHPSRMGASILGAAGLGAWVAEDEAGYVARAVELARDVGQLEALRAVQRDTLRASRLFDAPAFARDFEEALRGAATVCSGREATVLSA